MLALCLSFLFFNTYITVTFSLVIFIIECSLWKWVDLFWDLEWRWYPRRILNAIIFFCVIWTLNITRKRQQNSRITLPLTKVHTYYGRVTTLFRTKAMIYCLLLRKVLENVNSTTKYDKMFRIVITIIFNKWISYLLRSLSSSAMVI